MSAAWLALLVFAFGCASPAADPPLPSYAEVRASHEPSDHILLDRNGRPLHERRVDRHGRRLAWTTLEDVSPALIDAVLQAEDRRFFSHGGVDVLALADAAWQRAFGSGKRGASTITMQLVGRLQPQRLGHRRTFTDKWRQIAAARQLEEHWTKRQILEAYVNLVTWRGELQGIRAASELLYGVAPGALTSTMSCVLAASLRAPNAHHEPLQQRSAALAARLRSSAALDADAIAAAVERVVRIPRKSPERTRLAPHLAVRLLGPSSADVVRTTVDRDVQRFATAALRRHVSTLGARGVHDGAVLVVDNATGDVLAYVGSSGPLSPAPAVDGVRAQRQAGSTLKPFLYALALEQRRLTPASLLRDMPFEVFVETGSYRPTNYDHEFRGMTRLRNALGSSLNVPAVRTLELVGEEAFLERLRAIGFSGLQRSAEHYGLGLALGSGEVTLEHLVNAYRTLANGGRLSPLRLTSGPSSTTAPARVYDAGVAFLIADILADRDARTTTFGLHSMLDLPFPASVKTGTSTDMRDNWCIGFSDRYTVGVWVGNFTGAPMEDVSGVSGAAPVWNEILGWLHRDRPGRPLSPPANVVSLRMEDGHAEWFLRGTEPTSGRIVAADDRPRIVSPVDGAILALDPDMPSSAQRVVFETNAPERDASWWLDGRSLADAAAPILWKPQPGLHTLQLRHREGSELDAIRFRVRAIGSTSPDTDRSGRVALQ